METLLKKEELILFLIKFEEQNFEGSASFDVYEVTSWKENNEVCDTELYLDGFIKWDGCSEISFGNGLPIHFCGKKHFERHKMVLDAIWDICSKKIKYWNNEIANC